MTVALYRWPDAAAFGRVVPKTKFYEHATIPTRVREKFVSEVQRISWTYKLAEDTIRLAGDPEVPEIQVFAIDVKGQNVSDEVLATIDRAVQTPIVFEINRIAGDQPQTRMTAAYKELGGTAPRLTGYFTAEWLPASVPRIPLPPALDLPGLYSQLLTPLLPVATRPGESVAAAADRVAQGHKIEREIAALEKRIRSEPQFNRKVELRRQLRERTAALAALADPARPTTQDGPWTS
jgi:hypothetical protein